MGEGTATALVSQAVLRAFQPREDPDENTVGGLGGEAGTSATPRIASCLASSCLSPLLSNVLLSVLGQDVQSWPRQGWLRAQPVLSPHRVPSVPSSAVASLTVDTTGGSWMAW